MIKSVDWSQFESIGQNCEFGLVQRHYGFDPISLHSFISINYKKLIHALSEKYYSLANVNNLLVEFKNNNKQEYLVSDSGYNLLCHIPNKIHSPLVSSNAKEYYINHVKFLKDKFLDSLKNSDKTFVYTDIDNKLLEDEIFDLFDCLRYGYNKKIKLLVVKRGIDIKDKQMYTINSNDYNNQLKVAKITKFGIDAEKDSGFGNWDINYKEWQNICFHAQN